MADTVPTPDGPPKLDHRRGRTRKDEAALPLYTLAYEESRRRVDDQLTELTDMRTRVVQYLALTSTATAFLVGTSLGKGGGVPATSADRDLPFYVIAVAGSLIAVMSLFLALRVILGWAKVRSAHPELFQWRFRLAGPALVEWAQSEVPRPPAEASFRKALAYEYDDMYRHNQPRLARVRSFYVGAITLGFVQLLVWGMLVWVYA